MILPQSGPSSGPGQGRKVLLVDDHPIQRQWVGLRLACEGFEVDPTGDGPTALERARRLRPDVVLADVLMHGMDGFNLCAAIREDPLLRDLPVVLVSNVAMDRNLARAVGANALVVRCPDLTNVLPALLAALDDRTPAAAAAAAPTPRPASTRLTLDLARRTRLLEVELAGLVARLMKVALPDEANACLVAALACAAEAVRGRAAILRLESDGSLVPVAQVGIEEPGPALLELARAGLTAEDPLLVQPGTPGPVGPALGRLGLAWLLTTPLTWCGTTHGALLLGADCRNPGGDLPEFARRVGGWLGYALRLTTERARLSRRERRFLEELRTLDEAAERRAADPRDGVQHAVASILATTGGPEAVPAVIQAICSSQGWEGGAVWMPDDGARQLHCVGTWHASPAAEALLSSRQCRWLGSGQDLARQAWTSGRAIRSTSRPGPLSGAVACPIPGPGEAPQGVLELVSRDLEGVDEGLLAVLRTVAVQLGQFLERKRAEERVRASETHTRSIIEAMPIGLIAIDEEGRIESVNPAAERMFGYVREELRGEKLSHLVPGLFDSDPEGFRTGAGALSGGPDARTCEGLRKTGRTFPIELTVCTLPTPDGRASFAAQVRDLSERCEVERLKSEFVAIVSHELRTPLTSIHGSLGLLGSGALGQLPEDARRVVSIAERNTVRLVKLINDILDIERLERGGFELDPHPIDLDAVIERSAEAVRGVADAEGVSFALPAPTGALLVGCGDRLVQVLVNLLGNAVKFSPRGGTVSVTVAPHGCGESVEVRVVDRGRGIPESKRGLIFGRFQQVEASDARRKGGTGLGLAISKAIVERHGGTIGFESREGQGSEFWFRIPAAPPERRTGRVQVLRETGRTRR